MAPSSNSVDAGLRAQVEYLRFALKELVPVAEVGVSCSQVRGGIRARRQAVVGRALEALGSTAPKPAAHCSACGGHLPAGSNPADCRCIPCAAAAEEVAR